MTATPMLEIKGLGKRFPARPGREPPPWIIQNMSFSVGAGELLTIVGPSGAGKSTLLNIIAQIDAASAGEIVFDGERIVAAEQQTLHPGLNRRVGYVTQDDNLLPWRTTIDNVLFPLEVQGALDDAARARAQELIAAVDAQTRIQLQEDLLRLWSLKRKTIIFVTHDITEAIALGDRALVLTQRPAHIAAEHPIPIPRPRNVKDIFTMPGFAAIYERIRADVQ